MRKLVDTPEARTYEPEIRKAVVKLVKIQVILEWRYWLTMLPIFLLGATATSLVDQLKLPIPLGILARVVLIVPVAILWVTISLRIQRWVLVHRRGKLLHAIHKSDPPESLKLPPQP